MAYHLSQDAQDGLSQYSVPAHFGLLPFQEQAVRIALQHINKRNGVIIGDVVGLGKTRGRAINQQFQIQNVIKDTKTSRL